MMTLDPLNTLSIISLNFWISESKGPVRQLEETYISVVLIRIRLCHRSALKEIQLPETIKHFKAQFSMNWSIIIF